MTRSASAGSPRPVRAASAEDPATDGESAECGPVAIVLTGGWTQPAPEPATTLPGDLAPEVFRRAVGGDDRAFATLVEHYDSMLRELVFHLLGDRTAVDDVLQTTYVKAYRALPRLSTDTEAGPWLYRMAYLVCLAELRRRYRHPGQPGRTTAAPPSNEEQPVPTFAGAFSGLPADRRAAVILADRAGLRTDSIASVLGVTEAAVAKLLGRARTVLHGALDEHLPEPELDVR